MVADPSWATFSCGDFSSNTPSLYITGGYITYPYIWVGVYEPDIRHFYLRSDIWQDNWYWAGQLARYQDGYYIQYPNCTGYSVYNITGGYFANMISGPSQKMHSSNLKYDNSPILSKPKGIYWAFRLCSTTGTGTTTTTPTWTEANSLLLFLYYPWALDTACPISLDQFNKVSCYIDWVKTTWTYSNSSPIYGNSVFTWWDFIFNIQR